MYPPYKGDQTRNHAGFILAAKLSFQMPYFAAIAIFAEYICASLGIVFPLLGQPSILHQFSAQFVNKFCQFHFSFFL